MRNLLRQIRDTARQARHRAWWELEKRRVRQRLQDPADPPGSNGRDGAVLCFLPHAGVRPQLAAVCVLARTLKERGHRVLVTRCFEQFERCPVMDMYRLEYPPSPAARADTCLKCGHESLAMLEAYGLEALDLRSMWTPDLEVRVQDTIQNAPQNLLEFEFESLAIGKLAAADLALATKRSDLERVDEAARAAWLDYLRSGLRAYLLVSRICTQYPVTRLVHYGDYQLNLCSRLAAAQHGIPAYSVVHASHRNVDFRRYVIRPTVWKAASFRLLDNWTECRDLPLPADRVREIAGDQLVRLGGTGSHIYSTAKTVEQSDVYRKLGLERNRKLLVAYSSSLDEVVASRMGLEALNLHVPDRPQPFAEQVDWLRALIEFVHTSDDLQLVVRVHPREGATSRSPIPSEHLQTLKNAFPGRYPHCRIVWPEEPVSSYDLGEAAHLVLTSWSTIGLEMARLGVPVLVAFNGRRAAIPQDDFLEWGATRDEYFAQIRQLLTRPVTLDQVARAYRWYNLYHLGLSMDLGDVVPSSQYAGLPEFRLPAEANAIESAIMHGSDVLELNVSRLRAGQDGQSKLREQRALRTQIRRHIHFMFTGEDSEEDFQLLVEPVGDDDDAVPAAVPAWGEPEPQQPSRRLELAETVARYYVGDRELVRDSPMIARLALLCGTVLKPAPSVDRE